jgi:hypothetical protein
VRPTGPAPTTMTREVSDTLVTVEPRRQ